MRKNLRHWFNFAEAHSVRAYRRFGEGDFTDNLARLQHCAGKAVPGRLAWLVWLLRKVHNIGPLIPAWRDVWVALAWFDERAGVALTECIDERYRRFDYMLHTLEELRSLDLNAA